MIPAEAVEAAKKVAFERYGSKPDTAYLRTILEAAAPHMLGTATSPAADIKLSDLMHQKITERLPDRPTKEQISAYVDAAVGAAIQAGFRKVGA